jgi:hypothetical protein
MRAALLHPLFRRRPAALSTNCSPATPSETPVSWCLWLTSRWNSRVARGHPAKVGVDPDQIAQAVIGCWQDGEVTGLQLDDLSFEEARSLTRPAMTYVRGQLRGRLTARIARAHRRWLHPTSGRRRGDQFL